MRLPSIRELVHDTAYVSSLQAVAAALKTYDGLALLVTIAAAVDVWLAAFVNVCVSLSLLIQAKLALQ